MLLYECKITSSILMLLFSFVLASDHSSTSKNSSGGMHWALIVLISAVVSTVFIAGLVTAFKFWQKRKRQQEQARFLKLFEEGDDIEDEFGIGPLGSEV